MGKSENTENRFSGPIVKISIATIALSLTVMLLSMSIVSGFKSGVYNKVTGFSAHIRVTSLNNNFSHETDPIDKNAAWVEAVKEHPEVSSVAPFATKLAILKTGNDIQGVLFKGLDAQFDRNRFEQYLVQGTFPDWNSSQTLISERLARKLNLAPGDSLSAYYLVSGSGESRPRSIPLQVTGTYSTGMQEVDEGLVLTGLPILQFMYNWSAYEVSGFEILLHDLNLLYPTLEALESLIPFHLLPTTIREEFPDIFYWLPSLDQNAIIIIGLMLVVSLLAMSTTLLILILERTHTIGILKTLGMTNWSIRKIFWVQAFYIIRRGVFWGNLVGLGLLFFQWKFALIGLDESQYYLKTVPVEWLPLEFVLLNATVIGISMLVLIFPSWLVTRLNPVTAIRFS
jgi:lipoprotein-releasing system permease protein